MNNMDTELSFNIEQLISKPINPKQEFIQSGCTYEDIYNYAANIISIYKDQDDIICICTENKSVIMGAFLASLTGGPQILLPYSFTGKVIEEVKDTIDIKSIIADNTEEIPDDIEILSTDLLEKPCTPALVQKRDPDSVFLKLFTGGSTGTPKIWTKTPNNIFSEASYLSKKFDISKNDLFVSTVPPQHIYGLLFSIILPFISSAKVIGKNCIYPQEIINSIKNNATILVGVPMHYRVLRESSFAGHSLRKAFSSAGPLDEGDVAHFYKQTGIGVTEVYGSTETGGIASRCRTDGQNSWESFSNIETEIEDELLLVKSEFISPGLPFNDNGFFVTGDRVKFDNNGNFTLLGRADGIVKVAGKRVDLMEIQNKIKNIPGVSDVVVVSIPSDSGRMNEIAALIVSKKNITELKKSVSSILEPYAVPRKIKIVDKIPLTPTGKYNRKAIENIFFSSLST